MAEPDPIDPDTKDWTWVLERPCPECGFDPGSHSLATLPGLLHDAAMVWSRVLAGADAARRPEPDVSTFADWDQDETAVASRYPEQDPATVDAELVEAAGHVAVVYATVTSQAVGRRGTRSDGSGFSVETLVLYHLHDVLHHVHDVGAA